MSTPTKCRVVVRRLGRVSYSAALSLQQRLVSHYKEHQVCGELPNVTAAF